jgi:hypothetical protein
MNMTTLAIPFVAFAVTLAGCMSQPDSDTQEPGLRGPDAPLVTTPMAPGVDNSVNTAHDPGNTPQHPNTSSSPAGGNPQMSGH